MLSLSTISNKRHRVPAPRYEPYRLAHSISVLCYSSARPGSSIRVQRNFRIWTNQGAKVELGRLLSRPQKHIQEREREQPAIRHVRAEKQLGVYQDIVCPLNNPRLALVRQDFLLIGHW